MRINAYLALATGLSRRQADLAIKAGRVTIGGQTASLGQQIGDHHKVTLDGRTVNPPLTKDLIMLNKPVDFVVSRKGQGGKTVYGLLPPTMRHLKPVGRLDKDSSGLLLMTNDGHLAFQLTHPSTLKLKKYLVTLNKNLQTSDLKKIRQGINLDDGLSRMGIANSSNQNRTMIVSMHEGRNRQIRRTFAALGYDVIGLHRTEFAGYKLGNLASGKWQIISGINNTPIQYRS